MVLNKYILDFYVFNSPVGNRGHARIFLYIGRVGR
jgi:hypothetical protein